MKDTEKEGEIERNKEEDKDVFVMQFDVIPLKQLSAKCFIPVK